MKHDAAAFGWSAAPSHDWAAMRGNVQDHIKSLNFKYRVALREAGVAYLNKLGSFVDAHTLKCVDKKGKETTITSARFVVASAGGLRRSAARAPSSRSRRTTSSSSRP